MGSASLFTEIKRHPRVLALVILVHVGLAIMLSINLASDDKPPMPAAKKHNIINAVAVDAKAYDERKQKQKQAEQKKIADQKAAEKRKKELQQKKAEEKKRQQEQKKAAEAKRQKEIALKKKQEEERKAKEKAAKEKAAREKAAKEKAEREKAERERKEKERLEAEKKRKAEEERKRRAEEEAERKRQLLEDVRREEEARKQAEYAARLQTLRQRYVMDIKQDVENNWLRPPTSTAGKSCDVIITQTMTGEVIDVRLQSCTPDTAFQRSVERAVRKASPLPLPPNPDVFDREIYFTFNPN